jgi:hypothetical protein
VKARRVKRLDPAAPLADAAERIVRTRLDELCALAPAAQDPDDTRAAHDLRIAAKRLRYVLEATAEPCFGPYAGEAAKHARALQDVLGEIHDCDVLLPRLDALRAELREQDVLTVRRRSGRTKHLDPSLAPAAQNLGAHRGLEALTVHLRALRALLHERFVADWRGLEREGFRELLEEAVAQRPSRARNGVVTAVTVPSTAVPSDQESQ